jgi:hypothetical protein
MEKLDKERYLKRVIVVCWIALAICVGIKLFGGNLFEIMCNNENFIKVCEYADNHFWADVLISSSFCFIQLYFFNLAICQKIKYRKIELIILIFTSIGSATVKILLPSIVGLVFDIWSVIIFPVILLWKNKNKMINILIGNILLFAFQLISMFTKNIGVGLLGDSILEGAIFSIDVILMIILHYAYANIINKKEKENGKVFCLASMRRRCRTEEDERTRKRR